MIPGVVASSRTAATAPAYLLAEDWAGINGASWDAVKWPYQRNGTVDIQSNAGRLTAGGRPTAISVVTATDFELLVKGTWNTLSGINPEIGWRIAKASASSDPQDGYVIQMNGSTVTIFTIGGYGSVASVGSSGLNVNGSFWFRINVVGSTHKIRWWPVGNAEPGTWQITGTHSTYPGGRFGFTHYGSGTATGDALQITDLSGNTSIAPRWHSTATGYMNRTATGLIGSDFTVTCWLRADAHPSTAWSFVAGANYYSLMSDFTTGFAHLQRSGGNYTTTFPITLGTWCFAGISYVASTGITTMRLAAEGGAASTFTSTTGNGVPTSANFGVGGDPGASLVGAISDVKVWAAALSVAEMDAERTKLAAQRSSGLWGEYRLDSEPFTTDTSGNTRTLVHGNALPYRAQGPTEPT